MSPSLPGFGYLAWWPADHIVKAGFASSKKRWRAYELRGATMLLLCRHDDFRDAFECETLLDRAIRRIPGITAAFESKDQAVGHLGGPGGGYTECYRIPPNMDAPSMLGALLNIHARVPTTNVTNVTDVLTLDALPLPMRHGALVTRAPREEETR